MLEQQSITDPLTGLHNRRYFDIMLNHDLKQSGRTSPAHLAVIDLNEFKRVNDENGHHVGDQMLIEVARFLQYNVRTTDTVARIGGDEFALLLHYIHPEEIEEWGELFIQRFEQHKQDSAREVCAQASYCGLSVGIVMVDMDVYPSAQEIMKAADQAMYEAKHSATAGNRIVVCKSGKDAV